MSQPIRYIELFAGVGGFRYGIERANDLCPQDRSNLNHIPHFKCVYANEFDNYANSVYCYHFGPCDIRDIRTVPTTDIPDHELLVAGFPCQAFSMAGKRRGFLDTRGTLFFEVARMLRQKRPRLLLLENVKGLLSRQQGKTFATVLSTLDELGYDVQWQVCNSKDFGVPQQRERVFIVGHLRGTSQPQVFPFTAPAKTVLDSVGGVLSRNQRPLLNAARKFKFSQGTKVYGVWGITPALTTDERQLVIIPKRKLADGDIDKYHHSACIRNSIIRNLTPLERERLQGFPDHWTRYGIDNRKISDTQRFKMLGNAVTTAVVTAIVTRLAKCQ